MRDDILSFASVARIKSDIANHSSGRAIEFLQIARRSYKKTFRAQNKKKKKQELLPHTEQVVYLSAVAHYYFGVVFLRIMKRFIAIEAMTNRKVQTKIPCRVRPRLKPTPIGSRVSFTRVRVLGTGVIILG